MILDMRRHTHYTSDITKYNSQKDKSYALINRTIEIEQEINIFLKKLLESNLAFIHY